MPTYTTIPNTQIEPEAPVTSELMTLLRDNPISVQQVDTTAPLAPGVWHPYNMDNVGDGATGIIYNQAVDGNVNTLTSPNFEDRFEYMFIFDVSSNVSRSGSVGLSGGTVTAGMSMALLDSDNTTNLGNAILITDTKTGSDQTIFSRLNNIKGQVIVGIPRITKKTHPANFLGYVNRDAEADEVISVIGGAYTATDRKVGNAVFNRYSAGTVGSIAGTLFTGGTIKMYRRRVSDE